MEWPLQQEEPRLNEVAPLPEHHCEQSMHGCAAESVVRVRLGVALSALSPFLLVGRGTHRQREVMPMQTVPEVLQGFLLQREDLERPPQQKMLLDTT